ncbi:hypothetical protein [Bacillus sp. B1-b2]|uniref:hypothetical protein n=1 Tax=Bacillus sp. B1-b2 TaxID=2653201 RepID=UPI0012619C26|nr:hypothetical protein [Bacillus sp. B1-b2]KAB7666899.1 hypothetical protein F9279_16695 [Bacillus sp. B1-b2]
MKWNKTVGFFVLILLFVGLLSSPFWLWQLKSANELNILIMDKTVPDDTYREHSGLVWLLNNQKYLKPNGEPYYKQSDYKGFKPTGDGEYKISELPESLDKYDVIYMTDQYGVYEEEFYGSNTLGERSNQIYGGLQVEDVEKVENALFQSKNKTLIAEFNTFASPTSDEAREKITNLLNVSWSGWIGRYFPDLEGEEVPVWVKENYEETFQEKWSFTGSGLVFINKDDHVFVLSGKELDGEEVRFATTTQGKESLNQSIKSEYGYWFDIVSANDEQDILANYTLPVSDKGKKVLDGYGLPSTFPAIIKNANEQYSSYYFAGDYADEAEVPSIYETVGLDVWKKFITYRNSFYWNTYVPIMKSILKDGLHNDSALKKNKVETMKENNFILNSKTNDEYVQVLKDGKWTNLVVKGVNMGISKPGAFPGETAITKEEYMRWFKDIGAMHANTIRIYTLHPPAFYEALYEYNQLAEEPLYLFHGAWINEEILVDKQDAYAEEVQNDFETELKYMIDIVHGNATLPERVGHASGEYTLDISKYVLGYMIGIEWDPKVVKNTDELYKGKSQLKGTYFETENGSPFEIWLAGMMDETAKYEADNYQWQHTMSFTNWVTTDLLDHPAEPAEKEDMAVVDPNHIKKTDKFYGGLFASYHVYPYYPDFLNFEESYSSYINKQGKQSNYAAYLHDLREAHNMPVLIAEFGVPSSRGKTHDNINVMNQGFLSETQQGNMDREMFQMILDENYAGGLVFTWQDEWFKRTWNTMDYDDPDRRPYWSNIQTNEQHFGLLSFDPGKYEPTIYVDGNTEDWDRLNVSPIYTASSESSVLKTVHVTSDEQQVNIRLDYNAALDLSKDHTYLLLDTIDNQGQTTIKLSNNEVKTDFGVDFLIDISDKDSSEMFVDSYYDSFTYHYGSILKMIEEETYARNKASGIFNPIRLTLNKELEIPDTKIPFQSYVTGKLTFGSGNPNDKDFNSLTDISISNDKKTLEIRIPWALLNVKDPSQKEIMADLWEKGLEGSEYTEGIRMAVVMEKDKSVISSLPELKDQNMIMADSTQLYTWDKWEEPAFHERLKSSYYILQDYFQEIGE